MEDNNQTAAFDRRVHVAAGCDENYALPLAVMLASLEANLGSEVKVVAHVLHSGLQPATRQKIAASVDSRRIEIDWIPVEPQQLAIAAGTLRSFDTVSLASYHRLLLPTLLPATLDRVIYLDCDLVLLHDLWDLWRTDVSGHCLGAVRELLEQARYAASPSGVRLYRELGLPPDLELFNAGVMLINLARWRQRLLGPRAFHYLREAGTELRWHDQEALNVVVAGDWLPLDVRWNVTLHAYRDQTDPALRALVEQPRIVHYNASVKPWQSHYRLSQRELFFRYVDATQWSGWRPVPERYALAYRLARRLRPRASQARLRSDPAADAALVNARGAARNARFRADDWQRDTCANAERRDSRLRAHCRQRSCGPGSSHASARPRCRSRHGIDWSRTRHRFSAAERGTRPSAPVCVARTRPGLALIAAPASVSLWRGSLVSRTGPE